MNEGKARTHSFRSMLIWALFIVVGCWGFVKERPALITRVGSLTCTLMFDTWLTPLYMYVWVWTWKIIFTVTDIQTRGFFFLPCDLNPFSPHWLLIGTLMEMCLRTVRSDWGLEVWLMFFLTGLPTDHYKQQLYFFILELVTKQILMLWHRQFQFGCPRKVLFCSAMEKWLLGFFCWIVAK